MPFPKTVRVHELADYFYCCERSRLVACDGLCNPKTEGLKIHEWLNDRPRTTRELKLSESLKPYEPFTRVFDGVQILAHPDDLTVLDKVQIIEYKTVDKSNLKPWKSLLHKYQVQLYAWVLEPILKEIGYNIAHYHTVVYLKRNGLFIRKVSVEHDPFCTERLISQVFSFWEIGQPLIKPMKWKCQECSPVFKSHCRLEGGSHGQV